MRLCLRSFLAAVFSVGLAATAHDARAEQLRPTPPPPADCTQYLRGDSRGGLLDWRQTVAVEHCDRIKRLWNIAAASSYSAPPQFFDGYVAANRLPRDIHVALPLLRVVFPERVFFDTDSAQLRPEAQEVVRIIARNLQAEPPDTVLFVAGHTDARGDRLYNQDLSVRRANAVADAILAVGVNVAAVWRVGFGEDMPLRAGDTEEAWGQNRRVEFLFAARAEAVAAWLSDAQLDMLCQGATTAETQKCLHELAIDSRYVARRLPTVTQTSLSTNSTNNRIDPDAARGGLGPHQGQVEIDPVGTQRIIINPVNRRAGPVEAL